MQENNFHFFVASNLDCPALLRRIPCLAPDCKMFVGRHLPQANIPELIRSNSITGCLAVFSGGWSDRQYIVPFARTIRQEINANAGPNAVRWNSLGCQRHTLVYVAAFAFRMHNPEAAIYPLVKAPCTQGKSVRMAALIWVTGG